jgi:CheY-like chemotaxis protein
MNDGIEIEYASLPDKYMLIAEDDEDDVSLLRSFLGDLPEAPELLVINKGDKVISFFENLSGKPLPRLIILDYNLPSVSGYEILIALAGNKIYEKIPKIIWSTSNSVHFERKCISKGAAAYLVKPSDINGFQVLVRKLQTLLALPQ